MANLTNFHSAEVDLRFDGPWYINGNYVQDTPYLNSYFDHIKKVGFDAITIATNVPFNVNSGEIATVTATGSDRSLPRNIWQIVDLAKQKGFEVLLKLHIVDVENDNPIRKDGSLPKTFSEERFFSSVADYEKAIAAKAQQHNVDGVYVGVEQFGFDVATYASQWGHIVNSVRSVFNGKILYEGSYSNRDNPLYQLVDIISLGLYYEKLSESRLTDPNQIVELYKSASYPNYSGPPVDVVSQIETIAKIYQKPLLLDHLGFFSSDRSLYGSDLWQRINAGQTVDDLSIDKELQTARYEALFNLVGNYLKDFVTGMNFEQYMPWADSFVHDYLNGSSNPWAKVFYQFAIYGFTLNQQPWAESTINKFISESWGFRTYFTGTEKDEVFIGTKYNDFFVSSGGRDSMNGLSGNDIFVLRQGNLVVNGGEGTDFIQINLQKDILNFLLEGSNSLKISDKTGMYNILAENIERVNLSNHNVVALDIQGNAGQAYRLYQAALDRTPDERGLAGWIKFMDEGGSLIKMAQQFIDSQEFSVKYGALDDRNFVNQLYLNVLDRNGEAAGINGWVNGLANGLTRADVLKGFSESGENQTNVLSIIQNGISYTEWWLA